VDRADRAYWDAKAIIRAQERVDERLGVTHSAGMWPELEKAILEVVSRWRRPSVQSSTPGGADPAPTRAGARRRTRARYMGDPSRTVQLSSPSRPGLDTDWTPTGHPERGAPWTP